MLSHATAKVVRSIERLAGRNVLPAKQLKRYNFNGNKPVLAVAPQSEEQVAEIVKAAAGGEVILTAVGAAQQVPPVRRPGDDRPVVLVCTQNLREYIGYSHEDLTLTVQSGMTLSELDELTDKFEQHLPVDPPRPGISTLGGAIATNAVGPRGFMHGTLADYVLGGAMVLADGSLIKSGAQTVKNVAGYDLHKLFCGSYGSLGIVTRVALKLKPIPEEFRIAEILVDAAEIGYHIGQVVRGKTRPSMIEVLNSCGARDLEHAFGTEQVLIYVGYEDTAESVEWQLSQLQATHPNEARLMSTEDSVALYERIVDWPARECAFAFEAIVLGSQCDSLIDYCTQGDIAAMAHAGTGVVFGRGRGKLTPESADAIRDAAGSGSSVKFTHLPEKCSVSRWAGLDQTRKWMCSVKEQFDPQHIFPWPSFLLE